MRTQNILVGLVNVIIGLIEIILSMRLLLRLLGANPNSPFVAWLYDISTPFLAPFTNMFPTPAIEEGAVLELTTLFAIVVYAIIGWIITALIDFMFRAADDGPRRRKTVREYEVHE